MDGVSVLTKTYVTIGLVILVAFEFVTAMYLFGNKGSKSHTKTILTIHRVGGYIFLFYWIWPMVVGCSLLTRLSRYTDGWQFDGPRFYHAFLAVTVFLLLILKIFFIRLYKNYRTSSRWLGIIITLLAIITWVISGGFWLAMMGGISLY
jgi:hypothetical protein